MKELDELITRLEDTSLGNQLEAIASYYDSIEHAFDDFTTKAHISCPHDCGECCKGFTPPVTSSEALIIAAYTYFVQDRDVSALMKFTKGNVGCPFADMTREGGKCSIYKVRPLLCRLFGASVTRTKRGLEFRRCSKLKDLSLMPELLTEDEMPENPPIMDLFGLHLEGLEGNSAETDTMQDQVERALSKLLMIISLLPLPPDVPNAS
ncbi:MAG: YkgJ family cysteine cluster protein [Spirochaetales bacterium]|uniref:YkgJ family cysteine cluster protein n=1 Tax=Bullifex sp. TaxID=2815808 RepID=UPI002A529CC6|nr:YkgJ family cysteine cluster protein [Bullifex sp.]MDD5972176.1 YkgJ family cysteine cluster protein [Spirochaetales bacterium]MDD7270753.1 YkgJ family cysteine cluster protein [Spirochaetales bacterium]MDY4067831.1 YkgJ family cysteine cluster protein [Bullifex sp.]